MIRRHGCARSDAAPAEPPPPPPAAEQPKLPRRRSAPIIPGDAAAAMLPMLVREEEEQREQREQREQLSLAALCPAVSTPQLDAELKVLRLAVSWDRADLVEDVLGEYETPPEQMLLTALQLALELQRAAIVELLLRVPTCSAAGLNVSLLYLRSTHCLHKAYLRGLLQPLFARASEICSPAHSRHSWRMYQQVFGPFLGGLHPLAREVVGSASQARPHRPHDPRRTLTDTHTHQHTDTLVYTTHIRRHTSGDCRGAQASALDVFLWAVIVGHDELAWIVWRRTHIEQF